MIPTEPIGSIPRPLALIEAMRAHAEGGVADAELERLYDEATRDTIARFEATGSPVVTDGEQRKTHNFATYCVHGLPNFASDGFRLQFVDHFRQLPRLTAGPFRYVRHAHDQLREAQRYATRPVKQALIAPSALSLLYPGDELPGYPREVFLRDLLEEHHADMVACLALGADSVQVDFTEGRLACKLDPSGALLNDFISLNNLVLDRFEPAAIGRIGVHTCPGGDCDSTHSADVDYAELLPQLFELNAGRFYVALAREADRVRVLTTIRAHRKPWQTVFVGVIDPLDPRVESPEAVRDRVLEAAEFIPLDWLGTTDDCGFSPFSDDVSTSRDTAFAKIEARLIGTRLAEQALGARRTLRPSQGSAAKHA